MSLVDIEKLSAEALVAQFILESKDKGLFLSYLDYDFIHLWLKEAGGDVDLVLLVLSEILPDYFKKREQKSTSPLKFIHTAVIKKIRQAQCVI
ncbi:MAG: hypothetical protein CMP11_02275 [Zetaproteobacteria bacterium]|nr:hypothetical protein [Pseudobdellovibrionaceae bacterium]|tara:strand:- start:1587 stop:1865 length:279 start_codon:yes stop_codon:yes gene_type:complete